MSAFYYNLAVAGSTNYKESNDCCVIAWATVFQCEYAKAHKYLKEVGGRAPHRGMFQKDIQRCFEGVKLHKWVKGPYSASNKISLKKFINKHPEGRFFVVSRGHAFAVVDGVVLDYKEGLRRQVKHAWRVYEKSS